MVFPWFSYGFPMVNGATEAPAPAPPSAPAPSAAGRLDSSSTPQPLRRGPVKKGDGMETSRMFIDVYRWLLMFIDFYRLRDVYTC